MDSRIARNRRFLTDLFAGPFRGHGIIMDPVTEPSGLLGDVACSDLPVGRWLDHALRDYEADLMLLGALDHDGVPQVKVMTGTEIFAQAFGCPVHVYKDSPPCALPLVRSPAEADALKVPGLDARPLTRVMELAQMLRGRLGPDVPIRVPDIQSPFDIAALVWRKEDFYLALMDDPAAVKRLVEKCRALVEAFLNAFRDELGEVSFAHCPRAWAPPELGCWLSEDEAGSMTSAMFEEFCVPALTALSKTFGGIFIHCCATADHQYPSFLKIPGLRGMNRVFQESGPRPAIEAFSGRTVLMMAWIDEATAMEMLDLALPETRFLFNMPGQPLEEARGTYERLRERCPRS